MYRTYLLYNEWVSVPLDKQRDSNSMTVQWLSCRPLDRLEASVRTAMGSSKYVTAVCSQLLSNVVGCVFGWVGGSLPCMCCEIYVGDVIVVGGVHLILPSHFLNIILFNSNRTGDKLYSYYFKDI